MNQASNKKQAGGQLAWWQLTLLGVACTIGTGFFLGSAIGLSIGGPALLLGFMLAAFGTYVVFDMLARMTVDDPLEGSFRSYAKKAYGRWAGFSSGWMFWCSELLIMGSQMTALSLFTRFWFPAMPLWVFACGYAVLGLAVIVIGTKGFERMENVLAVMKLAAILMFILIASLALGGLFGPGRVPVPLPLTAAALFPSGPLGAWSSLIYAFYGFGGIEVLGLMALRLRNPQEAPKSGKVMITLLTVIYALSLALAIIMMPWEQFHAKESPLITALSSYRLPFVPHVFNAVLIIAGFSTMVASLFAVTTILTALAKDRDAPALFAAKGERSLPFPAIGLTAAGLVVSILMSLLLPEGLYEYVSTAAGLLLLYNWLVILAASGKLLKLTAFDRVKRWIAGLLLGAAITGTLFHGTSRPGFWVSLAFIGVIAAVTWGMSRFWKSSVVTDGPISALSWRKPSPPGQEFVFRLSEYSPKRLKAEIKSKDNE